MTKLFCDICEKPAINLPKEVTINAGALNTIQNIKFNYWIIHLSLNLFKRKFNPDSDPGSDCNLCENCLINLIIDLKFKIKTKI